MNVFCIPDTQVKPGVDLKYLKGVGKYINEKQPDHVVMLGDFADMHSLSSYDRGKKSFEGRRYTQDIEASKRGMDILMDAMLGSGLSKTKLTLLLGNHENRIDRAIENQAELEGLISTKDLKYAEYGWKVVPFLETITINGVVFSHFFTSGPMGRPVSTASRLIATKHQSCVAGHQQGRQVAYGFRADGTQITAIIAGSCLTPDHKVLTADLRYVELGTVKAGDKLVSFAEQVTGSRSRRYQTGTVEAVKRATREVFAVTLDNGKVFKVTKDHKWFVRTGSKYYWKETHTLRRGTRIPQLLPEFETDNTYEGGWLAGMYDGEGHLYQRKTTGGVAVAMGLSQKGGPVLDKVIRLLNNKLGLEGFSHKSQSRDVYSVYIKGGVRGIVKALGSLRPGRLLAKFTPDYMGSINCPDKVDAKVVSIKPIGEQEIVEIAIDAKTMIVEGYGHHNCYTHDESYMGPQGNKHWRGMVCLYEVKDGSFDEAFVSLGYLKRRFK